MISRLVGKLLKKASSRRLDKKQFHADRLVAVKNTISGDAKVAIGCSERSRILDENLKVRVDDIPMETTAFFDVSIEKGVTVLQMNSSHLFSKRLLSDTSAERREAMEVCLAAWAKMERECTNDKRLAQMQITRRDWGQLLDDYLEE